MASVSIQAELYWKAECVLAEGPVWHGGALYWTDILGKSIYSLRGVCSQRECYHIGLEVGSFAIGEDGKFVLAAEQGFYCFNAETRELKHWTNAESSAANRFNDGKCDPVGRFVAGTLSRQRTADAGLYVLDRDKTVRKLLSGLTCSNGLAWSESGTTFYHIDTPTQTVRAFAYDLETGALGEGREVIQIPEASGKPDGMTIDREGNLWIALWQGWGIECWNPRTGESLTRVKLPVARVTSCVFGGSEYDTLFITTARQGMSESELAVEPLAGSIFCARPGAKGYPAQLYRGLMNQAKTA